MKFLRSSDFPFVCIFLPLYLFSQFLHTPSLSHTCFSLSFFLWLFFGCIHPRLDMKAAFISVIQRSVDLNSNFTKRNAVSSYFSHIFFTCFFFTLRYLLICNNFIPPVITILQFATLEYSIPSISFIFVQCIFSPFFLRFPLISLICYREKARKL